MPLRRARARGAAARRSASSRSRPGADRSSGDETSAFPGRSSAHRSLPGVEPADAVLSDDERVSIRRGARVASCASLHARETLEAVDPARVLPVDLNRRADMPYARRARPRASSRGSASSDSGPRLTRGRADPRRRRGASSDDRASRCSCTGICICGTCSSRADRSRGVIDWGDVCVADPCDRSHARLVAPPACRTSAVLGRVRPGRRRATPASSCPRALPRRDACRDTPVTRGNASLERECVAGLERTLID